MENTPSDWTTAEHALWNAFLGGDELDLQSTDPTQNDPFDTNQWDGSRTIRAEVLRSMLLSRSSSSQEHPLRLRLTGARICGELDLGCGNVQPFLFRRCRFDNPPYLNDATGTFAGFLECNIPRLVAERFHCTGPIWLSHCQSYGIILPDCTADEIEARHLTVSETGDGLIIHQAQILRDLNLHGSSAPRVLMARAKIGGNVDFAQVAVKRAGINAFHCDIDGSIYIGEADSQVVILEGSNIEGKCVFNKLHASGDGNCAVNLDHANIRLGFQAVDVRFEDTLRAHHAKVGCQASFRSASLHKPDGVALQADHIVVDGSFLLNVDTTIHGAVDIHGSLIQCTLNMTDCVLSARNSPGSAFDASNIGVGGNIIAKSLTADESLIFNFARIAGNLNLGGAKLSTANNNRPALGVAKASVATLKFGSDFLCEGEIILDSTVIETDFILSESTIANDGGLCINAPRLNVKGNIIANSVKTTGSIRLSDAAVGGDIRFLDSSLYGVPLKESSHGRPRDQQSGREWRGTSLLLNDGSIKGDIDCRGSLFEEAVVLESTTAGGSVVMTQASIQASGDTALNGEGLQCEVLNLNFSKQPGNGIDLTSANVSTLADDNNTWPQGKEVHIDGFKYQRIASPLSTSERLRWLRNSTRCYTTQPYDQLATCLSSVGQESAARVVSFESIKRYHREGTTLKRIWGSLQEVTIGFGYKPARAVFIFLILWTLGALWFTFGAVSCSYGQGTTGLCPVKPGEHPTWDPWLYSLDLLIPVVNLGHDLAWDPTGVSKVVMYALISSGWILATTIIAAASRTLRRN